MEIKYIIAISKVKGIGGAFFKKHISFFKSTNCSLKEIISLSDKFSMEDIESNLDEANDIIEKCKKNDITIISISEDSYPQKLIEIGDPPPVIYIKGNISLLNSNIISIIGTRKSTELGNNIAKKVGAYFSETHTICNGLVDGIDRHVVENLENSPLNIIGVISGGLNLETTSSAVTRNLANKILSKGGLIISEVEPDVKEDKFSGSKASRIQAGLSSSLLLVQSSVGGGSKYTIKTFSKLNRTLGVINFHDNSFFQSDEEFGANRLIVEHRIEGVARFCDIKKVSNILIKKIVLIKSKKDYIEMDEISDCQTCLF